MTHPAQNTFDGTAAETEKHLRESGKTVGISLGRRSPLHRMHVDCIAEIAQAGLAPVVVIGSVNPPESPLYDPVRNPLTVTQQKEQLYRALPGIISKETPVITLEDNTDDALWMKNLVEALAARGLDKNAVVHFRSKSADAAKAGEKIKPLSAYAASFIENGLGAWQSYNVNPNDDAICASDIRGYDLENMTTPQKEILSTPDYILEIAQKARAENPDKDIFKKHSIPLTLLDLSFDRLRKEAGISSAEIFARAEKNGPVTLKSLTCVITQNLRERHASNENKKPLLLIGNNISAETAAILKNHLDFAEVTASIGKFQSGELFTELFHGENADFTANADRIRGAKAFVVQSTSGAVGDSVQHLLEMIHTLKFYGAEEVTATLPFAAFSRQDRPFDQRFTSVAADLMAKQLKAAGADKVVSFTMHSQASSDFYRNVFGNNFTALSATDIFSAHLKEKCGLNPADIVCGAPDGAEKPKDEGQKRARELALSLSETFNEKSLFKISKVHTAASETKITAFEGDVAGKHCVVIDDMVDGGTTLLNAARTLKEKGAASISCCFTHAILTSGDKSALEKLMTATLGGKDIIDRLVTTDAVPDVTEKLAEFTRTHPAAARRIDVIPLGTAILQHLTRKAVPAAPVPRNPENTAPRAA